MFSRDFMIRTDNRTLEETPYVLNCVGMDITPNPFLSTVVDCLMPSVLVSDTIISRPIIGIDSFRIRSDGGGGRRTSAEDLARRARDLDTRRRIEIAIQEHYRREGEGGQDG